MTTMRILTLPVNKAAFDMLADPNPDTRKNEEYRRICKHWVQMLMYCNCPKEGGPNDNKHFAENFCYDLDVNKHSIEDVIMGNWAKEKQFDAVKFTNGYGHKEPSVIREWKGLTIGKPNPLWVPKGFLDLDKDYFRIELGEILTAKQD